MGPSSAPAQAPLADADTSPQCDGHARFGNETAGFGASELLMAFGAPRSI